MSRWVGLGAAALAVLLSAIVSADVALPGRTSSGRVVMPVVIRRGAIRGENGNVQAKVIIPRYLLDGALETYRSAKIKPTAKDAAEAPASEAAPAPPAAAPPAIEAPPAAPAPVAPPKAGARAIPPWGTIIAGVAMSLAAVSAVFVVRDNRGAKTAALVLIAGGVVLGAYAVGRADVPPGRRQNSPEIVVQLVDDANEVTLLLTR
jgi:hypothetical protein